MWFYIVLPLIVSKAFNQIAIPLSISRGITLSNVTEQLCKVFEARPVESPFYFGPTHPWRDTNLGCQSFQFRCSLWALLSRDPRALRLITFARTAWPALNGQKSFSQLFFCLSYFLSMNELGKQSYAQLYQCMGIPGVGLALPSVDLRERACISLALGASLMPPTGSLWALSYDSIIWTTSPITSSPAFTVLLFQPISEAENKWRLFWHSK